jgi:hypothetical protein
MIASALRTDIERFYGAACERAVDRGDFERCAAAARRLVVGRRVGAPEETLPATRALSNLVQSAAAEQRAAVLSFRAICEYMAARLGLEGASLECVEETLDAIDDMVQEPSELPLLREQLRRFTAQFEQMCQESTRVVRTRPDLHVSAA